MGLDSGKLVSAPDVASTTLATITAEAAAGISGSVDVTVQDGPINELRLIADADGDLMHDGDYVVAVGGSETWVCQGRARATDPWYNLNESAVFATSPGSLVTASNAAGSKGLVSRWAPGAATVECRVPASGMLAAGVVAP